MSQAVCLRSFKSVRCHLPARRAPKCCAASNASHSRRDAVLGAILFTNISVGASEAGVLTKSRLKKVPIEEYSTLDNGLKYYDYEEGAGGEISKGDKVTVHFDVYLGKVDAVSSRYSALLGKNEVVPEPYQFIAGRTVSERKAKKADAGISGGSFSGLGGPKPPPALSSSVYGMKRGGKRSVIVTADQAYGDKGYEEIPPGKTVEMMIEILDISSA